MKKVAAYLLMGTLIVTSMGNTMISQAAKSGIKLNAVTKSAIVGKTIILKATVTKKKSEKVGKVKWTVSRRGYVAIKTSNKGKTAKVTLKKKGMVVVSARVKVGKKNFSSKCKIKIGAKSNSTNEPTITQTPEVAETQNPQATVAPTPDSTVIPSVTVTPTVEGTKVPTIETTKQPTQSQAPDITQSPQVTQAPQTNDTNAVVLEKMILNIQNQRAGLK